MNATDLIKTRRSIRKYKNEKVKEETLKEIIELSQFAPSWANGQIARYTLVQDDEIIKQIAQKGVNGFAYNMKTLENAQGVAVLSYVLGKSGILKQDNGNYSTNKGNQWEMFDAGIACQTFCLAAHEKGVGTCIFGVIDDAQIAKIINLPEGQTVAAIITYGYPDEEKRAPVQLDIKEVMTIL